MALGENKGERWDGDDISTNAGGVVNWATFYVVINDYLLADFLRERRYQVSNHVRA